ncbi:MAG TPA: hypothetical protein VFN10_04985 [Thermoanaerobaculia bacterium]|nr:hypothetical protein [Thermoanaerobaculia bacterium]
MKRLLPFLLLLASSAFAGDGSVSLSPATITLRGEPGQSTTQTLLLHNGTSRTLTFDVEASDVIVRNGKREFARAGSIAGSIAATAVTSQKHVVIESGASVHVDVTLTVPHEPSSRAVVVIFHGADKLMNGTMPMTANIGTLMTFALSDQVTMSAAPLHVQPQTATANLAVSQTCTNSGSEPLVAKGILAVLGSDGKLAGKTALQPHRLLPGESADLGAEYAAELQPGHYRVLVTYDIEGKTSTHEAEVDVP